MDSPLLASPPPHPRRRTAVLIAAGVVAGLTLGVALAGAFGLDFFGGGAPSPTPTSLSPSARASTLPPDCFFALGGGTVRSGGLLPQPRTRAEPCWGAIKSYLAPGGGYDSDVAAAVSSAAAYLASIPRPSGASLVILDIDETALSNRAEWLKDGAEEVGGSQATKDASALAATAPPLAPTLRLYRAALGAGFSVAFVTGRSGRGEVRNATVENLAAAGYGRACGGGGAGAVFAARPPPADAPPS